MVVCIVVVMISDIIYFNLKLVLIVLFISSSLVSYSQVTYSKDWQGNTVKKDANGNTLGTYSEDWQGNTIYTPEK